MPLTPSRLQAQNSHAPRVCAALPRKTQPPRCGLGHWHYELRIDGAKIGQRELDPAWTDCRRMCAVSRSEGSRLLALIRAVRAMYSRRRRCCCRAADAAPVFDALIPSRCMNRSFSFQQRRNRASGCSACRRRSRRPRQEVDGPDMQSGPDRFCSGSQCHTCRMEVQGVRLRSCRRNLSVPLWGC